MNSKLYLKFKSSASVLLLAASFVSFSPQTSWAGICFLPDCEEEGTLHGDVDMNVNEDTEYCKEKGYTYYASGECPKYYAKIATCPRDEFYIKCDAKKWCDDNGYKTTSCSIPQYVNEQCPNGQPVYKNCKTDNARACRELGYTNSCPSGQKLKKNSGRCPYDSSYGTCCKPSGCPAYTSTNSSNYGTNGTDGCEYTCYYTCNINCPSGTSTSNPGGCGGSTTNGCGNKTCYYPYKACCTPSCSNQYGCSCGTYTISNGCGGTCTRCSSCCTPKADETGCSNGTYSCSDGCGGTRRCCSAPACTPKSDESCPGETESCSDGCGGTRKCCKKGSGGTPIGSTSGRIWFEPTNKPICWTVPTRDCPSSSPYSMVQDVHEWCDCGGGIHQYDRGIHSGYLSSNKCYKTQAECNERKGTSDFIPKSNNYLQGNAYNGSANCSCK